jgi:plasmid stabilization system protein ParE
LSEGLRKRTREKHAIKEFIGRDSPTYALGIARNLYHAAETLVAFPESGRVVPERGQLDIRELIRPPYRIIYRRGTDLVEILTIHHSSRPLPVSIGEGAV